MYKVFYKTMSEVLKSNLRIGRRSFVGKGIQECVRESIKGKIVGTYRTKK